MSAPATGVPGTRLSWLVAVYVPSWGRFFRLSRQFTTAEGALSFAESAAPGFRAYAVRVSA